MFPKVLAAIVMDYLNYLEEVQFAKLCSIEPRPFEPFLERALSAHGVTDIETLFSCVAKDNAMFSGSIILEAIFKIRYPKSDIDIYHLDRTNVSQYLLNQAYECTNCTEKQHNSSANVLANTVKQKYNEKYLTSAIFEQIDTTDHRNIRRGRYNVTPNTPQMNLIRISVNKFPPVQGCDRCLIYDNDNFKQEIRYYDSRKTILKFIATEFDFDICQCCYDPKNRNLFVLHPNSIQTQTSQFNKTQYLALSDTAWRNQKILERIDKYKQRNFLFPCLYDKLDSKVRNWDESHLQQYPHPTKRRHKQEYWECRDMNH